MNTLFQRLSQRLQHFLTAGIEHQGDLLLLRKLLLVTSLLMMIIFLFSFFTLYNFIEGHRDIAILDFGGLAICLFAMWQLQRNKRYEFAINIVVFALFGFLLLFASVNQNHSYGLIWTFFFPVFTVLLKGQRMGTILVAAFYAILLPMSFYGIGQWQDGVWDLTSFIRFSLASLVIYYSAYFNELSIQRSYDELQQTRRREIEAANAHASAIQLMLDNKQQLMVDISHELRTPLAAMRVNLEAIEDGIVDQKEGRKTIHNKLIQLNQLIEDVYLLSKADVDALSFNMQPIAVPPLIQGMMDDFRQLAHDAGITIEFFARTDGPIEIMGDSHRLYQCLANLLNNSLHYTDSGGRVEVHLSQVNDEAEILIMDSTPGVSDDDLPHLFERFYRVDKSRSRATGGSGLGLAICQAVIEQHSGRIEAAHSPLGGLQVRVALPLYKRGNE